LKGILLECRRELLVALVGVNEDHDGRNGAGTTYIPGRSPTWVMNPAAGARVTV
jgi:hypothetical protein